MISDEKFAVSLELMEQAYDYLKDGYEQALSALEKAEAENARLRELCGELLYMAESNDPDFSHWPEMHDELRKVGVKIVKIVKL